MDLVVGVDIHIELVPSPAGPIPTPFPHPHVGLIYDPIGYAAAEIIRCAVALCQGVPTSPRAPVMVGPFPGTVTGDANGLPVKHIMIPPGAAFARGITPSDADLMLGSQTVSFNGSAAVRTGEIAMACSDPVRLPTATVISISTANVMVGGPPGISLAVAAGSLLRTKFVADKMHRCIDEFFPKRSDRTKAFLKKAVCYFTGHPVNVATGQVLTSAVDFELPGPLPLRFERQYLSNWCERDSSLGFGWAHSLEQQIWIERYSVVMRDGDGREVEFDTYYNFDDAIIRRGQQIYNAVERSTLRCKGDFAWEVEDADGLVREFSPIPGENPRDKDRGLARLTRLRAPDGHEIRLLYDERAQLREVVDSQGRTIRFEHKNGKLDRIWLPSADGKGHRQHVQYLYSEDGDLLEVRDAMGKPTKLDYDKHLLVQETNRNGLSFYFKYDGFGRNARCTRTWGDGEIYNHLLQYDLEGFRTLVFDSHGACTVYSYDPVFRVREIMDPHGATTKFEYDEYGRKSAETDALGGVTRYTHDERGNLVMVVAPDKAISKLRYDDKGNLLELQEPTGALWKWTYDSARRAQSEVDPLGHATRFVYEDRRLTTVVDALGKTTKLAYDRAGNLIEHTLPNGAKTQWRVDALGRVTHEIDARGQEQRRTYDGYGRLVRIEEPDGNVRQLAYDGEGNVVRAQDRLRDIVMTYQGMNKLASRTVGGTTVRYEYDAEERLVAVINERGHRHAFERDARGEVKAELAFDELRTLYVRDALGRPTTIYRGDMLHGSEYAYDTAGRLTTVTRRDGPNEAYRYREDGALLEATNDAATVVFERDLLGRVTKETQTVRHPGQLPAEVVAMGKPVFRTLLEQRRDPNPPTPAPVPDDGGRWVQSLRDHRGLRIAVRSAMGAEQTITRDAIGSVTRVAYRDAAQTWETQIQRDVAGLEVDRTLPGGVRSFWWRDKLGRPTQHFIGKEKTALRLRKYAWDLGDRLRGLSDEAPTHGIEDKLTFRHDPRGYLHSVDHGEGRSELRAPDAVGGLFRTTDRTDAEYGLAGQILKRTQDGVVSTFRYDVQGRLCEREDTRGDRWAYHWDEAGMLEQVDLPNGQAVTFGYDALGRRVWKNYAGQLTRWVWDGDVPLHEWQETAAAPLPRMGSWQRVLQEGLAHKQKLAEGGGAAGRWREYVEAMKPSVVRALFERWLREGEPKAPKVTPGVVTWLFEPGSFAPMARIDGARACSIVGDHLGTPLTLLDENAAVVWQGVHDTRGVVRELVADVACPWRFPGQYEDRETGLYYNRWRYYCPQTGAYARRDPIGLRGGLRAYGYVDDPLVALDPLGLTGEKPGVGCGAAGADLGPSDDALRHLSPDLRKSVKSWTERAREHRAKLDAYRRDPDAFDNRGILKNAPTPEIRQSIIEGRIRHLETEIANFDKLVAEALGGTK